ncbi:MAG TPA: UDP-N-acetylglucosamine--N-acetylmuramyl-(pentapeptide) pyrophosphoryl-undecaprenol N-acetylglucosamine transferase [Candidatus Paceibacterota bacterium]|nr:UDP-N-acetylglucosamine--N-acetylmuramyl-(pentapeptide) pyrophosphoryl-undecaprenol N-acetylglucosamine transferase [Candidatus Pacearchaeota archaeon]HRZ51259.1 UDP-N-acetylglucosamine--N-acetylmuramyl-(pentapeptide) pyrophosphoryl-undecaprenol N-acetylglucosamine transferase [Candidatus Paceibacterota bacterium]HSA36981.1 UDP-N-acetylglucosamine--N-acetylmuramyl-(pentapeptide) pyrophosphoryl-undecaprenol N-acetylglucosamine transferase [Candidatus Paceibacterota bacterium]
MKIIFTGGGSGGHLYPIIAVIRELQKSCSGKDLSIIYIGPKDAFSDAALAAEGIKIRHVVCGKIRRYFSLAAFLQNIIDVFVMIPIGVLQSFFYIFVLNPDLVYSKCGFGSYPITISAWILGVPIFLQESDVAPGLASRKVASQALEIFSSFPKTEFFNQNKLILTGNPIRETVYSGSRAEAKKTFNLSGTRPVIFVEGGSLGAQRINDKLLDALPFLLGKYEIIHLTGKRNFKDVIKESKAVIKSNEAFYHPIAYADENTIAQAYAAADLVVSRAGGGSIFEIAANKKPSVIIPLPEAAQNHQAKNAMAYAQYGAALIIEENNFTVNFFQAKINDLFEDSQKMRAMSEAAARFARPKAAKIIAEYIKSYLTKP